VLYLADVAWEDSRVLMKDVRTRRLATQLYEAVTSISPNIAEGYSRGTGRDRARFYEYALGSAREGRDWYFKSRHVLDAASDRLALLSEVVRLLLTMIPQQRHHVVRETVLYENDLS
jgi:four helix bundle protein